MKDQFIAAHEELIERYMEQHGVDWQTAYEATADGAYNGMVDRLADRADAIRQRMKDEGF